MNIRTDSTIGSAKPTIEGQFCVNSHRLSFGLTDIEEKKLMEKNPDECKLLCEMKYRIVRQRRMLSKSNMKDKLFLKTEELFPVPMAVGFTRTGAEVKMYVMWDDLDEAQKNEEKDKKFDKLKKDVKKKKQQEGEKMLAEHKKTKKPFPVIDFSIQRTQRPPELVHKSEYHWMKVVTLDLTEFSQFVQYVNLNYKLFLYCEAVARFFSTLKAGAVDPQNDLRRGKVFQTIVSNSNGGVAVMSSSNCDDGTPFWIRKTYNHEELYFRELDAYRLIAGEGRHYFPAFLGIGRDVLDLEYRVNNIVELTSLDQVRRVLQKGLEALAFLSQVGIIHHDISRGNVLLGRAENGEISLTIVDFAYSCTFGRRGIVSGTQCYIAPEVEMGQPVSYKADVWSFGVVVMEYVLGCLFISQKEAVSVCELFGNEQFKGRCDIFRNKMGVEHHNKLNKDLFSLLARATACNVEKRVNAVEGLEILDSSSF